MTDGLGVPRLGLPGLVLGIGQDTTLVGLLLAKEDGGPVDLGVQRDDLAAARRGLLELVVELPQIVVGSGVLLPEGAELPAALLQGDALLLDELGVLAVLVLEGGQRRLDLLLMLGALFLVPLGRIKLLISLALLLLEDADVLHHCSAIVMIAI